MPNQIQKQDNRSMPEKFIEQAIEKGLSVEAVEKLIMMRRELRSEFIEEQFNNAMMEFQKECPVIKKEKEGGKTSSGIVAYKYSPLEQIIEKTKEVRGKHGFSYIFKTAKSENRVIAKCIVKHKAGHKEESIVDLPLTKGTNVMSQTQIEAATMTFAKRYAFCDAFGIVTGGEDNEVFVNDKDDKRFKAAMRSIEISKDPENLKKYIKKVKEGEYDDETKEILILEAQNKINKLENEN